MWCWESWQIRRAEARRERVAPLTLFPSLFISILTRVRGTQDLFYPAYRLASATLKFEDFEEVGDTLLGTYLSLEMAPDKRLGSCIRK